MPYDHIDDIRELRGDWSGPLVTTAIHQGHELRPDVRRAMTLDERSRRREEDPYTDVIGAHTSAQVIARRSRFEVDLNRPRQEAVYQVPEDCWGLDVWRDGRLPDEMVEASLEVYDVFYADLARRLDELAERGPFVVYDVHSYNHRRQGDSTDVAPPEDNPEVNLGTGSLEDRFRPVAETFTRELEAQEVAGHRLDVRENVKFEGRALAWFVHERYPGRGACLALEFKKTFMDEWTDEVDEQHLLALQEALAATHGPVVEELQRHAR